MHPRRQVPTHCLHDKSLGLSAVMRWFWGFAVVVT